VYHQKNFLVDFHPDEKEIRDFRWVPIEYFVRENLKEKFYDEVAFASSPIWPHMQGILKGDIIRMKGLYLQSAEMKSDRKFLLWGLTMRMTNAFMEVLGFEKVVYEGYIHSDPKIEDMLNENFKLSKL
jgi:hypothetical protein